VDEGTQEGKETVEPKADLNQWHRGVNESLTKAMGVIESVERRNAAQGKYFEGHDWIKLLCVTTKQIVDELTKMHGFLTSTNDKIAKLDERFNTSTQSTATSLEAIMKFVEQYTPLLEELQGQERYTKNIWNERG
jgi:cell division protein ZapA (FtsZ GTPase activity inhibitor)